MVDFTVANANDGEVTHDGANEASEVTPLISLKERRKQIVNDLFIDVKVPRWDEPEIFVRFAPVSATKFGAAMERRRKQKAEDWTLLANIDMLIDSCVGVYALLPDSDEKLSLCPGSPYGEWTKFDTDLGESLGITATRASDVCRSLYLTEGDLIDTANKIFRWSGLANEEADEAF